MPDFCMLSPDWHSLEIVTLTASIIGLIVTLILGGHGSYSLWMNKKVVLHYKLLFIFIVIFAVMIYVSVIIASVMCTKSDAFGMVISNIFTIICYHLTTLTLVLVLYARLHLVFKATSYEINPYYFYSLLSVTLIAAIIGLIGASFYLGVMYDVYVAHDFMNIEQKVQRAITVSFVGHIAYIILSIWGLALFTKNMNAMAMIQAATTRAQNTDDNVIQEIELQQEQITLIKKQTKYLVLLSISLISSCIFYVIILTQGWFGEMYMAKYGMQVDTAYECVDVLVNVVCLYLQYKFAEEHYHRFCGCCQGLCFLMMRNRVTKQVNLNQRRESRAQSRSTTQPAERQEVAV